MLKMHTSSGACLSASLRKEVISSSLRASSERAWISPPAASISFTSGSSLAPLRRPAKIVKPSEANFLAISPPMKSPAPMTATVAFFFCTVASKGKMSSGERHCLRIRADFFLWCCAAQGLRQFVLEDLSSRGRRQRIQNDNLRRPLVGRQLRSNMRHQVLRACLRALEQLDEGDHLLIALHRPADHGALHDGVVG